MDLLALTFLGRVDNGASHKGDLERSVSRLPARAVPSLGPLRRTHKGERAGIFGGRQAKIPAVARSLLATAQ